MDNDNAGCAAAFTSDATLSTYDSFTGGVVSFTGAYTGTVTIKASPLVSTETLDLNSLDPGTKVFGIDLFYPTCPTNFPSMIPSTIPSLTPSLAPSTNTI